MTERKNTFNVPRSYINRAKKLGASCIVVMRHPESGMVGIYPVNGYVVNTTEEKITLEMLTGKTLAASIVGFEISTFSVA